ncbi:hypothetical protein [Streptomyces sp. NPDC056948]|uniref:hypothetical protein n=1 Tax=Streptomyces sp. NPDC056948 TaxID=3345975 RepID=UPI00363C19F6
MQRDSASTADLYIGAQAGQAVASYLDFPVDDDAVAADVAAQEGGDGVAKVVFQQEQQRVPALKRCWSCFQRVTGGSVVSP